MPGNSVHFLWGWWLEQNLYLLLLFREAEGETQTQTRENLIKSRTTDLPTDTQRGELTMRQAENIPIVTSSRCVKETNAPIRTIISVKGDRESNQVQTPSNFLNQNLLLLWICMSPSCTVYAQPWWTMRQHCCQTELFQMQTQSKTHREMQAETINFISAHIQM